MSTLLFPNSTAKSISFTVYARPEPQGSSRAVMVKGYTRPFITSANKKLKPYRQELTNTAITVMEGRVKPYAAKHVPVEVTLDFYLERPPSIPKKRTQMVVRPDIDKTCRSTIDSLKGILWVDDAQVTSLIAKKFYGTPERVEIRVQILE